jgi:glycosyltransferase involved in cell wall biosynthesis
MDYGLEVATLSSFKDGNALTKLMIFSAFFIKYIFVLITARNIQLIHIHGASEGSVFRKHITIKIAKLFHKKVIYHIHGAEFDLYYKKSSNFIKQIMANSLNKSDLIIVLSKEWENKISNICSNKNIRILYNPTVIKEINHIESQRVRFLFMGRLEKRKGIYDIIEAAKYIKNPDVIINLYGDGNLEEFQKLIIDNNLQEKVQIKGWISGDKKNEVFQTSAVLILPSYSEGLPMSILEAMAVGLPIISTPVGGIPEAVEDGVNGFLIQPGAYKALAEKIDILANDKVLREQMGQDGYKIAKEKFDINVVIKQLKEIHNELLIH